MAPSFSQAKLLSTTINVISRRGYAASASTGGAKGGAMLNKKVVEGSVEKVAWVPDPKTGFYRPENHGAHEIDAAELRAMLLNKNNTRAH